MNNKIKEHLDHLLKDAPKTRRIEELREELLSSCLDKYDDLTASGMSAEDAYASVISGIGDVDELVRDLTKDRGFDPVLAENNRQKKAMMIAVGIAMYVFALVSAIMMDNIGLGELAPLAMLMIAGAATALIVYANLSAGPRYIKKEDTIVEEIKVTLSAGGTDKNKKLKQAASSSLWSLIVLVYLFVGFVFNRWHPAWILFPFGAFLQTLLTAAFSEPEKRQGHINGSIILGGVCIFLLLGSMTHNGWKYGWLTIIFALAVQQIIKLVRVWRETE